MVHDLTIGLLLGLSAGFAPGPLLALVISETLQHGIASGVKVSLAPLITDAPIIILTVYVLSRLSDFETLMGAVSISGGVFVFYLGIKNVYAKAGEGPIRKRRPQSLLKGIVVNFLSPHPYLFWLSVGAPIVAQALDKGSAAPTAFIGSFYLCLVGAKITLALVTARSATFLSGRFYIYIMRFLGVILMVLGLFLCRDGFKLLAAG